MKENKRKGRGRGEGGRQGSTETLNVRDVWATILCLHC